MNKKPKILEKIESFAHLQNIDIRVLLESSSFPEGETLLKKFEKDPKVNVLSKMNIDLPDEFIIEIANKMGMAHSLLFEDAQLQSDSTDQGKHSINIAFGKKIRSIRQSKLKLSTRGKPSLDTLNTLREGLSVASDKSTYWSTEDLVTLTGISRSTLLQIEDGSRDCTLQNLHLIAAALGVRPYQLLMNSEDWEELFEVMNSHKEADQDLEVVLKQHTVQENITTLNDATISKQQQGELLQKITGTVEQNASLKEKLGATAITTAIALGAAAVAPPIAPIVMALTIGLLKNKSKQNKD